MHPGRILLEEFLAPRGISVWHLARDLGVSIRPIYEIVQGQRSVTSDIAHRLAHYFGMSERYWLDLQRRYDGNREARLPQEAIRKQPLGTPDKQGRFVTMESANTPRPTLAVIDGGLNIKARVYPVPSGRRPKLPEQLRPGNPNPALE
ncbi:MAG TPA: HigA family addiction module antitoxin [Candidatus Binatia bacterium]|nr:HigA family addiction module antitoxin [Candidatus Binatia bacterium]